MLDDDRYVEAVILKRSNEKRYCVISEQPVPRKSSIQFLLSHLEQSSYVCTESRPENFPQNLLVNDLNDDCSKEISKYLSLSDVCSVAEVCKKFQNITKQIFRTQFGGKISENPPIINDLCKFESFLRNIGTQVRSLSFNV